MSMKKKSLSVLVLIVCILAAFTLSACKKDSEPEITLTVSTYAVTMEKFSQTSLTATVTGTDEAATFCSAEPDVAALITDGNSAVITGVSVGDTAITVTVADKTVTVNVYVIENTGFPTLNVSDENVPLKEGDTYPLESAFTYQNAEIAGISVSYSSDNTAAAVLSGNVITAAGIGTATVTASVSYCGELFTKDINVTVRENATFGLDAVEMTLYTSDPENDGIYQTSGALTTLATKNGSVITASGVTWESDKPLVASVDDGVVTAKGKGSAKITATWDSGSEVYTASCKVSVELPVVDSLLASMDFDQSLNEDGTIDVSTVSYFSSVQANSVTLNGEAVAGSFSANVFTFDPGDLPAGEHNLIFSNGLVDCSVPVVIATMIVSNKAEFIKIKTEYFTGSQSDPPEPYKNRDGYFILDADIDFGNEEFKMYGLGGDTLGRIDIHGWFGAIDGRGHIVSRMVFGMNGLTNVMGWDSVIKNIGFVDCSFSGAVQSGILGEFAYGTLDNCFFQLNDLKGSGALAKTLYGVNFTNTVVYISDSVLNDSITQNAIANAVGRSSVLNNVFAVTSLNVPFISSIGLVSGNYAKYTSFSELRAAVGSLTSFKDEYWTKTDGTLIFSRYNVYLDNKFSSEMSELVGSYFEDVETILSVADADYTVSSDTYIDAELLENGILKPTGLAEGASATITLTVTSRINPAFTETKTIALRNLETVMLDDNDVDLSKVDSDYTYQIKEEGSAISTGVLEVIFNGRSITPKSADSNGNVTFDKTLLSANLGENKLVLITSDKRYTVNMTFATMIISDSDDFKKIKTEYYKGNASTAVSELRDGYFILDADINFNNAAFMMFDNAALDNGSGGTWDRWNDAAMPYYGWSGVLDGRGYTVYNVKTGNGGMFGHISAYGTIKNLGVRCTEITSDVSGVLANRSQGLIDNCFVELTAMPNQQQIGVIVRYLNYGGKISNSMAVLLTADTTKHAGTHGAIIQQANNASFSVLDNVYAVRVGTNPAIVTTQLNGSASTSSYGAFDSFKDMIAAVSTHAGVQGADSAIAASSFDGFEDNHWKITEDVACWGKYYSSIQSSLTALCASLNTNYFMGDSDVSINAGACLYEFTGDTDYLDSSKMANGVISVVGLNAGETKSVTLTITSMYDSTLAATATLTLKYLYNETLEDGKRIDIDTSLYDESDTLYEYTFTAKTSSEIVNTVKIGGSIIDVQSSVKDNSITLSIKQSELRKYLGERTLTIATSEAIYTLDITIASLIISDDTDFKKIKTEYYKGNASTAVSELRDGYFILDADINFNNAAFMMFDNAALDNGSGGTWDRWNDAAMPYYGWSGVLDGRGYTVYNVKTGNGGMFGHISAYGTIKNLGVRCTEITSDVSGVLANRSQGLIDNCFVELTAMPNQQQIGVIVRYLNYGGKISNSMAVLLTADTTHNAGTHGAIIQQANNASYSVLDNVYAVRVGTNPAVVTTQLNGSASTSSYGAFDSFGDMIAAVSTHAGVQGADSAIAASSFDGFDAKLWTKTANTVAWTKCYSSLAAEITAKAAMLSGTYYQGEGLETSLGTDKSITVTASSYTNVDETALANGILKVKDLAEGESAAVTLTFTSFYDNSLTATSASITLYCKAIEELESKDIDLSLLSDSVDFSYMINDSANSPSSVNSVKVNGTTSITFNSSGATFSLKKSVLEGLLGEGNSLVIDTDTAIYTLPIVVASLIISDDTDFMKIKTEYYKGNASTAVSELRDGYFILDNDIDFKNAAFMMFDSVSLANPAGGNWDAWGDATPYYGWSGVLDGRGYTVYNVKTGNGGMFGHISQFGTIKNLGVRCVEITSRVSGVLANRSKGLIDNCFVELTAMPNQQQVGLFVRYLADNATISNSIGILLSEDTTANAATHSMIAYACQGIRLAIIDNVYTLRAGSTVSVVTASPTNGSSSFGVFSSFADMITAVTTHTGLSGGSGAIAKSSFENFKLKHWTVTDDVITWKRASFTYGLTSGDVDSSLYNDSNSLYEFDLNLLLEDETLVSASFAGSDVTSAAGQNGGTVTVSLTQSQLRAKIGEQNLTIVTDKGTYVKPLVIASLIISDDTDFMKIKTEYYKGNASTAASSLRDGYFILKNDINFNNAAFMLFDSTVFDNGSGGTWDRWGQNVPKWYGWSGVIDGRGHMVYNVKTGNGGMFGSISAFGVIKNLGVRCTEITSDVSGVLANFHLGVIDNCFIELTAMPNLKQIGIIVRRPQDGSTISNTIAVLLTEDTTSHTATHGTIAHQCQGVSLCIIDNVYTVRPGSIAAVAVTVPNNGSSSFGAFTTFESMITGVTTHTGLSGGSAAINASSFNDFNSTYWTIDTTLNTVTFGTYTATL